MDKKEVTFSSTVAEASGRDEDLHHAESGSFPSQGGTSSKKATILLRLVIVCSYLLWLVLFSVGIGLSWAYEGTEALYRYGSVAGLAFTIFSFIVTFLAMPELKRMVWTPLYKAVFRRN